MNRYIIINADDFGLTVNTNKAIITSYQKGILTSTSLLVTTPGFNHAADCIKKFPKLGVGIHLSLTWGRAVTDPARVPRLVDKDGYFLNNFFSKVLNSYHDKSFIEEVKLEFFNQMEKAMIKGINIDHIDSQHHIHMIPKIFQIVSQMAKRYGIKYIRIPDEEIRLWQVQEISGRFFLNIPKVILMKYFRKFINYNNNVKFYGLYYSNNMTQHVFRNILSHATSEFTEILFHPGIPSQAINKDNFDYNRQGISQYMADKMRHIEFGVLLDKQLKKMINAKHLILTNYSDLVNKNLI